MNNFRFHYARAIITVPKTDDIEMNREIRRRINLFEKDNRMYIDLMKFLLDNQFLLEQYLKIMPMKIK